MSRRKGSRMRLKAARRRAKASSAKKFQGKGRQPRRPSSDAARA